jgi:hypothetical protein
MLATEWKKFSTRFLISGVNAPAITGGNAGRFSESAFDSISGIRPAVFVIVNQADNRIYQTHQLRKQRQERCFWSRE